MTSSKVIAEVSVRPVGEWFAWYVFAPGIAADQAVGHENSRTAATRAAVACVEHAGASGRVGIMSEDGSHVAYVSTGAVPDYKTLEWSPTVVQQVDLTALALGRR